MTFVSYAQNYEDVILQRALSDIRHGFYVDVGAASPVDDSVTKAFSLRGWRGINLEPVAKWHAALVADRPHDVNLRLVAGAAAGSLTFYEVADSGLSTTDAALAAQHEREGWRVERHVVEARTLDDILAEHAPDQVHFLKIDVEGAEADVLRGLSLDRIRPWILVIESHAPNSSDLETQGEWEPALLGARYRFVYEDGLNRFYLAEEHIDRLPRFSMPPNFWDRFVRAPEWDARREQERLRDALRMVETGERIGELNNAFKRAMFDIENMQRQQGELSEAIAGLSRELAHARSAEAEARRQEAEARRAGSDLEHDLAQRQHHIAAMHAELRTREVALAFWRDSHDAMRAKYEDILRSQSWRITRPLRVLRRLLSNGPGELMAHASGKTREELAATAPVAAPEGDADPMTAAKASPQESAARAELDLAWRAKQGRDAR